MNGTMQMLDGRPGGGSSVPFDDAPRAQPSQGRGAPPAPPAAPDTAPDFDDDIPF